MVGSSATPPVPSAFTSSTPLTPALLVPDTNLPPNTHVAGKVMMLWNNLILKDSTIPRITFCLDKKYRLDSNNPPPSNPYTYVPSPGGRAIRKKYRFKLTLFHSEWTNKTQPAPEGEKAEKLMERLQDDTKSVEMRKMECSIDVSGMKVVEVRNTAGRYDYEIALEGVGERLMQYEDGLPQRLLAEIPQPSVAPPWLEDSPPAPSVPSPVGSPTSPPRPRAPISASSSASSKFRPLLSHPVPPISRPLAKSTSTNTDVGNKGKRPSTEVIPDDYETEGSDLKRMRRSEPDVPEEVEDAQEVGEVGLVPPDTEVVRTVTQLGPPMNISLSTTLPPHGPDSNSPSTQPPPPRQATPPSQESPSPSPPSPSHNPEIPSNRKLSGSYSADEIHRERRSEDRAHRRNLLQGSQSSPTPMVDLDEEARRNARKDMEARIRAQRLEMQAESSRSAQVRMQGVEQLKRPVTIAGTRYSPLDSLVDKSTANVIGVIVDKTPPKRIQATGDMTMSVVIADPSRHAGDPARSEECVVSIFRKTVDELPTRATVGQVILFRNIRINKYNDKTKGNAYSSKGGYVENTWAILHNGKEIKLANTRDMQPPLVRQEVDRMVAIFEWWKGEGNAVDNPEGGSSAGRRVSLGVGVQRPELTFDRVTGGIFFDSTFKIMHAQYNAPRAPAYELYVADGTCSHLPLRNFHNVNVGIPVNALYTVAIHDDPPEEEKKIFQHGNVVTIHNLRGKMYKGELEVAWSEKPTEEQLAKGWKRRKLYLLDKDDPKAKEIERRIESLKRGEETNDIHERVPISDIIPQNPPPLISRPVVAPAPAIAPAAASPRLATHLGTTHTNPIDHPLSTIAQILANQLTCNKYRLHARVKSLHTRGLQDNDTFIQTYCRHCRSAFKGTWCKSCNDTDGKKAEWRYRFLAILEDESGEMAVIVADEEAAEFLPPLPPYDTSTNPNDIGKTKRRRKELSDQVENILLGAKMDGQRPRPIIDMSVEVYEVTKKGSEGSILVGRLFGMTSK
ncbi:hypothetical protein CI109_106350 [Kwoniella shandongensis]|uniref:Uncharacterized protein n=1 Tax=Kwoniella shandongensis TaxID=1734106 RepID=A0A5M6BUV9_9TREE|nr:uncharacterized protein CI109_005945 [Kwoniella shandongensis]KAA5525782.1 hypothetical protein CI109_005945 [Kwoniella shandongensis]